MVFSDAANGVCTFVYNTVIFVFKVGMRIIVNNISLRLPFASTISYITVPLVTGPQHKLRRYLIVCTCII